jgi:hypothetical protein
MTIKHMLLAAAGTVALALLAPAVQAAPPLAAGANKSAAASMSPIVEPVAYRCRWRQGARVCRWVNVYPQYSMNEAIRAAASGVPLP